MGDLFLFFFFFFENQLRTLVFVSWCYIQCFPCREKLAFGCMRGSDLLQACASKVRMWPLQALSQGWAWQEQLPFTQFPSPGNIPRFGSSVGWRSAGEEALQSLSCPYSPCARDGCFISPSADEFIAWEGAGRAGMLLLCYLKAAPVEHQPRLQFPEQRARSRPHSRALLPPQHSPESCTRRSCTEQFSLAHYWTKLRFELTFSGHDECFEAGRQN